MAWSALQGAGLGRASLKVERLIKGSGDLQKGNEGLEVSKDKPCFLHNVTI